MCCRDGRRKNRVVHESSRIARLRVSNRFKVGGPDRRPPGPLQVLKPNVPNTVPGDGMPHQWSPHWQPTPLGTWESSGSRKLTKLAIYFQGIRRADIVMLRQMERAWSVCLQGTEWKRRKGVRLVSQIARSEEATKNRSGRGITLADRPLSMTTAI
jgi:hypothetical protein